MLLDVFVSPFIDMFQSTVTCPLNQLYNVIDNGISEHPIFSALIVHVAVLPIILADPYGDDEVMNEGLDPFVVFHVAVTVALSLGVFWQLLLFIALENIIFDQVLAI